MGASAKFLNIGGGPSAQRSKGTKGGSLPGGPEEALSELDRESVEFFVSFVQVFGLPKSIGQIYGLLFVSVDPLAMDEIVARLGISKGSASQGLGLLRSLGAVRAESFPAERREYFRADLNVSRIVNHFFENRLRPRLDHGDRRLESMLRLAREADAEGGCEDSVAVVHRIEALRKWQKRGSGILPLMMHWLKR